MCRRVSKFSSDYLHKVQFLFSQLIIISSEIILPDAEKKMLRISI